MSYRTGFYKGRLGIGLSSTMGMGDGNPRYPLDINGDIRLTGSIVNEKGKAIVGGGSSGATAAVRKQALEEEPTWTDDVITGEDLELDQLIVNGTITSDSIVSKTNTLDNLNVGTYLAPFSKETKITASDPAADDNFGKSIAISGNYAIVGAWYDDDKGSNSGSAYIFNVTTGTEIHKLVADDGAASDYFGMSVAIDGNYAIVGAYSDDDNSSNIGSNSGSAYIFNVQTGAELHKLNATDAAGGDYFGQSVAISGNYAIVGAHSDDLTNIGDNKGSAYIFNVTTGTEIHKLVADDGAADDTFGVSVAIDGNYAIVGASYDDDKGSASGSAYIFNVTTGTQLHKLIDSNGGVNYRFGGSVAISGNYAIVGSWDDVDDSAFIFDVTTGTQLHKLIHSDAGGTNFRFGYRVAISGNYAIIGADLGYNNNVKTGVAYIFDVTTGKEIKKLYASDGAVNDYFGSSVAISGNYAIVGAYANDDNGSSSGSAYIFGHIEDDLLKITNDSPNMIVNGNIDVSGNVGIGTTSPGSKLEIYDDSPAGQVKDILHVKNYAGYDMVSLGTSSNYNSGQVTLYKNTATKASANETVVINANGNSYFNGGNVGIGTTDPKAKLHVKGGHLLVSEGEKTKNECGGCIQFHSVENGTDSNLWDQDYAHSLIADVKYGSGGYDDKTEMMFYKGNNGDGDYGPDRFHFIGKAEFRITLGASPDATGKHGHEAARLHSSWANGEDASFIIKYNGNVGIGTSTPQSHLHLAGTGDVVLRIQADTDNNGGSGEGDNPMIEFRQDGNLLTGLIGTGNLPTGAGANDNALYLQHCGSTGIVFLSGPSQNTQSTSLERMRITPSGNVGIGTTVPSQLLHLFNTSTAWGEYANIRLSTDNNNGNAYYGEIGYFRGTDSATDDEGLVFSGRAATRKDMVILSSNGNVGIGYEEPDYKLDIRGSGNQIINVYTTDSNKEAYARFGYATQSHGALLYCGATPSETFITSRLNHKMVFRTNNDERMCISNNGNIGIGTTSPYMPFDCVVSKYIPDADIDQYWDRGVNDGFFIRTEGQGFGSGYQENWSQGRYGDLNDETDGSRPVNLKPISAHFYDHVYISNGGLLMSSDERIKQNIIEISDDISLKILRDISCCSYYYIDDIGRQKAPTLGFIAQQVNKIFPQAVTLTERIIPNVMKRINNFSWVSDNSNNKHKLISDLQDVSGVLYRFYVSNNVDEREKRVEHIGNSDNTFTFENKWEHIFCYGYEVPDFHTLDKAKLFSINFSATQELDRQQQADKAKIVELKTKNTALENKVASLESELALIKQHLGL